MISRTNLSSGRTLRLTLALTLLASVAVVGTTSLTAPAVEAAPGGRATRYVPIPPIRVLDSRDDGTLLGGSTLDIDPLDVDVTDAIEARGVDPDDVDAVAVNITAFGTFGPGFLTSWPSGSTQPTISSLNFESADSLVPNLAIVPLGDDGKISIFSPVQTDLTVDVQGVFEVATSSTSGRFVPIVPDRAVDTRDSTPIPAGESITVDLTNQIPETASAAVLNVAVTETQGPGYLTVWEEGATQPDPAANVNYPSADYTVANNVLTGVNDGKVQIFSLAGTEVIVDVAGYMTGDSTDPADDVSAGLYVPLVPERLWDSRPNEVPCGTSIIGANAIQQLTVAGKLEVPATGVAAVAMNLTMTNTLRPGFLEAFPSATDRPDPYSSVNSIRAAQTVGNHAVVAINDGAIDLYSSGGTDYIADVTGYFLDGTATPPEPPVVTGTDPRPKPDVDPCTVPVPPFDQDFEYLQDAGPNQAFAPYFLRNRGYFGWRPCDSITYAVNVERANQTQINAMNLAIRQVENASGFDFVYLGEVTGSLNTNSVNAVLDDGRRAMAVIGFSDRIATPILSGRTIGIGGLGGGSGDTVELDPASNKGFIVRGGFALADIDDVFTPSEIVATLTHELGHMIGLDHVNAADELMQPSLTALTTFGNGDKNGLFNIGEPQCPGGARLESSTPESSTAEAGTGSSGAPASLDVTGWVADEQLVH